MATKLEKQIFGIKFFFNFQIFFLKCQKTFRTSIKHFRENVKWGAL